MNNSHESKEHKEPKKSTGKFPEEFSDEKRLQTLFFILNNAGKLLPLSDFLDFHLGTKLGPVPIIVSIADGIMKRDNQSEVIDSLRLYVESLKMRIIIVNEDGMLLVQMIAQDVNICSERIWENENPRHYLYFN